MEKVIDFVENQLFFDSCGDNADNLNRIGEYLDFNKIVINYDELLKKSYLICKMLNSFVIHNKNSINNYTFIKTIRNTQIRNLIIFYYESLGYTINKSSEEHVEEIIGIKHYLNSLDKYVLDEISEFSLACEMVSGNSIAREKFILVNLRLVPYFVRSMNYSFDYDEAISVGNLALIKAVDKFDPYKGNRFSTFAYWYIYGDIMRFNVTNRNVRIPIESYYDFNILNEIVSYYIGNYGKYPSYKEIAQELGWSMEKVKRISKSYLDTISINDVISEEDNSVCLEDIELIKDSFNEISNLKMDVKVLIDNCNLNNKQKIVLYLRYGFYNGKVYTLDEISKMMNLTKERIRQIEEKALRIIRNSCNTMTYNIYMDNPEESLKNIQRIKNSYNSRSCGTKNRCY